VIYRDSLKKFILFGILLFVLLTPLAWQMYRLQTDYAVGIGSNNSRFLMTQIAYRTFIKYPVLGKGPGEYINIIDDNIRFRAKFGSPLEAHGVYLKVAAENGIIGIIGFSLLILVFLKQSQEFLKKYMEPANILIFLAALSIILVEVFEVSYYKAKLWLPIVLALSAYEIISNERKKNNSGESHFSD
jgi:O-antigen ligase